MKASDVEDKSKVLNLSKQDKDAHAQICAMPEGLVTEDKLSFFLKDVQTLTLYKDWFVSPSREGQYAAAVTFDVFFRFIRRVFELKDQVLPTAQLDEIKKLLGNFFSKTKPQEQWNNPKFHKLVHLADFRMFLLLASYTAADAPMTQSWLKFVAELFKLEGLQATCAAVESSITKVLKANVLTNGALVDYSKRLKENEFALVLDIDHQRLKQPSFIYLVLRGRPLEVQCKREAQQFLYSAKLPGGVVVEASSLADFMSTVEGQGLVAAKDPMVGASFINPPRPKMDRLIDLEDEEPKQEVQPPKKEKSFFAKFFSSSAPEVKADPSRPAATVKKAEPAAIRLSMADKQWLMTTLKSKEFGAALLSKGITTLDYSFASSEKLAEFKARFVDEMQKEMKNSNPKALTADRIKAIAREVNDEISKTKSKGWFG